MDEQLIAEVDALLRAEGVTPPPELTGRRAALEGLAAEPSRAAAVDVLLLGLRELETAGAGLPSAIGGARRGRLLSRDGISSVWEAWTPEGQRVALRLLEPPWRNDPVWLRRLERHARAVAGLSGVAPLSWVNDPEWPHVRTRLSGPSLADLLPAEELPSERELARFLVGGLTGLSALHSRGFAHGDLAPRHLLLTPGGVQLAWFDPVSRTPGDPMEDLSALGRAVAALDPEARTRLGALAHGFAESPPPGADACGELLRRAMAGTLADTRHTLMMRARRQRRSTARGRLLAAIRGLERALPPPTGTFCLRAGHDAVITVATSDGAAVRGGPVAGLPAPFLPIIYTRAAGLDPSGCRALLRAWSTRGRGDEARRAGLQAELEASDTDAAALCRWLAGQARLRAFRLLLERSS